VRTRCPLRVTSSGWHAAVALPAGYQPQICCCNTTFPRWTTIFFDTRRRSQSTLLGRLLVEAQAGLPRAAASSPPRFGRCCRCCLARAGRVNGIRGRRVECLNAPRARGNICNISAALLLPPPDRLPGFLLGLTARLALAPGPLHKDSVHGRIHGPRRRWACWVGLWLRPEPANRDL
jgi:hypothetical protein